MEMERRRGGEEERRRGEGGRGRQEGWRKGRKGRNGCAMMKRVRVRNVIIKLDSRNVGMIEEPVRGNLRSYSPTMS